MNESRSQRKFGNRSLVILGAKHSGKRSLVDSLFDIAKTTLYNKKQAGENKMRLRGTTTAIDYAYLNVIDMHDPDNSTFSFKKGHMPNLRFIWLSRRSLLQSIMNWLIQIYSKTVSL